MKALSLFEQARKQSLNSLQVLPLYARGLSLREGRNGPTLEAARQLAYLDHAEAENIYLLGLRCFKVRITRVHKRPFRRSSG